MYTIHPSIVGYKFKRSHRCCCWVVILIECGIHFALHTSCCSCALICTIICTGLLATQNSTHQRLASLHNYIETNLTKSFSFCFLRSEYDLNKLRETKQNEFAFDGRKKRANDCSTIDSLFLLLYISFNSIEFNLNSPTSKTMCVHANEEEVENEAKKWIKYQDFVRRIQRKPTLKFIENS